MHCAKYHLVKTNNNLLPIIYCENIITITSQYLLAAENHFLTRTRGYFLFFHSLCNSIFPKPNPINNPPPFKQKQWVTVNRPLQIMSMSSSILCNSKPGSLLCSCSSSTSSFIFKFKFPARSQCSPLPTVEFHATTPRASTHNHISISIENESGSGAGASTSRRRALVFVAATTTPLLLLFNHQASAVKAAGLVSYCQHFFLPSIHTWILFHFYFFVMFFLM